MKLAWQQIPSALVSEIFTATGFDGVVLDTEHGCYNNETLYTCIQVITTNNKKCFVRLTEINKTLIRFCLDAGVDGLIFSTIENGIQASKIHELCKYPAHGGRRGLGLIRQNMWGEKDLISDPPTLIAQIETNTGVENFEDIAKYDFDFYMIGPYDLSASLGIPGQFDAEEYKAAVSKILGKTKKEKMAAHIPKDIENNLKMYEGYGILALGMDTTLIIEGVKEILEYA
tara:strand:- start:1207 stop:1893 length:687 start_codon:yes stop_codon:yes gene_type:complete